MEKKYSKAWIGKGVQHEKLDLVRVTLKTEDAMKHQHEFEGVKLLTFELSKLQEPDKFGRTHTAYVSVPEEVEAVKPKKTASKE
ncbi:hypothetical protein SAMN05444280_1751 [Tangfeifania diversioriginum]|uniref:Uncharacterized protein n=1 Tax=Tangfeifania diversioriginum TaxID=1168035 RepID=A0A1M6PV73_9BACT|nr:hypothetical protein [Tangfeifania diversioriginum]SHK11792.1 hypothetical protein SAMN05444280_1751 [Tangfeifania diversioriginum]